jgi:hypothetical protein
MTPMTCGDGDIVAPTWFGMLNPMGSKSSI